MTMAGALAEIGFYYPGHLWRSGEWIKTLLLFFDGIGLLVPEYKQEEPEHFDPVIAGPLRDQGLLHYLVADQVVDKVATERLIGPLIDLISSGALDALATGDTAFHAISMSRMGFFGDAELANKLYDALASRGLAEPSKDGVSIPLHPLVRYLILVLLAQILRESGAQRGFDLLPTTDVPQILDALHELLNLPVSPSAGQVVAFDLQTVAVDMARTPLDEVLAFRQENLVDFRRYARSVRKFSRELSAIPADERIRAFDDRQAELDDLASDLRRISRSAWKRPATFALALTGAAWTYVHGVDLIGALLGGGAAFTGLQNSDQRSAFSYLFRARDRFN
jgi:hypothetical protein